MSGRDGPQVIVKIDPAIRPHKEGGFIPALHYYRADGSMIEELAEGPAVLLGAAIWEANLWADRERARYELIRKEDSK